MTASLLATFGPYIIGAIGVLLHLVPAAKKGSSAAPASPATPTAPVVPATPTAPVVPAAPVAPAAPAPVSSATKHPLLDDLQGFFNLLLHSQAPVAVPAPAASGGVAPADVASLLNNLLSSLTQQPAAPAAPVAPVAPAAPAATK